MSMTLGQELLEWITELGLAEEIADGRGIRPLGRLAEISLSFDQNLVVCGDMFATFAPIQKHLLATLESARPSLPLWQKLDNSRGVVALSAAVHSLMMRLECTARVEEGLTTRLRARPERLTFVEDPLMGLPVRAFLKPVATMHTEINRRQRSDLLREGSHVQRMLSDGIIGDTPRQALRAAGYSRN
jgi:hypothetical protein